MYASDIEHYKIKKYIFSLIRHSHTHTGLVRSLLPVLVNQGTEMYHPQYQLINQPLEATSQYVPPYQPVGKNLQFLIEM